MGFQPFQGREVRHEKLHNCYEWDLPFGGTLTVGWGEDPRRENRIHVGNGGLWARLVVPQDLASGIDLPFTGWFAWTRYRSGMARAREAVENTGGFIYETGIMADYWEAAYRDLAEQAAELERCVVQATEYMEAEAADKPRPSRASPLGMLVGAYDELEPVEDGDDRPDGDGDDGDPSDWDTLGSW